MKMLNVSNGQDYGQGRITFSSSASCRVVVVGKAWLQIAIEPAFDTRGLMSTGTEET